ncbi:porin [Burkholderia sp. Ac-20379]|uniref:porin n=1 Tax=Burkholderia sp. Ac-20379 TaxID=2703900 RepID=UPI0019826AF8|nr:porin [Burkholderia sp. Ac-20379]MBN3723064.1 porin [Burkholderia sp. Ac-20379]
MDKTLVSVGLAGALCTLPALASAQSSVTLYGLIDAGMTYASNQHGSHAFQATSGDTNGSRWGIRGAEDLGAGLKAIFVLENGFNVQTGALGQNGRMFGRQAFAGLSSDAYGAVTLGRQYDSMVDFVGPLSLTGTQYGGTHFGHPYDNDNLDNSFRVSNSVKYTSISYGGLKFGGLYGFSNQAGGFASNRAYSAGVSYSNGPLNAAIGYLQLNNAGAALANGAVSNDATFSARVQRTFGGGASYAFGPAVAGIVITQTMLQAASSIGAYASGTASGFGLNNTGARFTNYEVNGRYNFTPAVSLIGSYTFTDARLAGASPKFNQVNLRADYMLSKRTDVYVEGEYQHVGSTGKSGITADLLGFSASSSNSQLAATIGIRTRF